MLVAAALAAASSAYDGCKIGWDPYEYTLENSTCLPSWTPTWGMRNSTVLCEYAGACPRHRPPACHLESNLLAP